MSNMPDILGHESDKEFGAAEFLDEVSCRVSKQSNTSFDDPLAVSTAIEKEMCEELAAVMKLKPGSVREATILRALRNGKGMPDRRKPFAAWLHYLLNEYQAQRYRVSPFQSNFEFDSLGCEDIARAGA